MTSKNQPNKDMLLKGLMSKGKQRLKGQTLSVKPNKERQILKGKNWRLEEDEKEDLKVEEVEDIIGKFPDEILVSIMCFLTTKEAARMSVVSRRWEKIWKNMIRIAPKLTFNIDDVLNLLPIKPRASAKFARGLLRKRVNEVDRVLKLHEAPTLYEFSLVVYDLIGEDSHINTWMDFAAKKHVKKLTLFLPTDYDPTFIAHNFHCLKDLSIQSSIVTENVIHSLFSNSPFLESLSLISANRLHNLKIESAPNLNCLRILRSRRLRHLEISSSVHNLYTMEISRVYLESVNISAPNLSHLILGISKDFKFDSYITLLTQIKTLTLRIENRTEIISAKFAQFPELSKVEHLELKMITGYTIPIHCLPDILKAAPVLNTFSFQECVPEHPARFNCLEWLNKYIPKKVEVNHNHSCQCLRVVKMNIFAGCQYEVEFLLHLLEYAVSVEKIIIQIMPSSAWSKYKDIFDNKYEELCIGCAQLLETKILQMHPSANVILQMYPSANLANLL